MVVFISENNDNNSLNRGDIEPSNQDNHQPPNSNSNNILQMQKENVEFIEAELGSVKVLDLFAEEPFEIMFNDKSVSVYQNSLFNRFFGTQNVKGLVHKFNREYLTNDYEKLNIQDSIQKIKLKTEEIGSKNGKKQSGLKTEQRNSLYLMIILFGALISTNFIPGLQNYYFYIMILMFPLICFLPNYIRKVTKKKWNDFKYLHREEIQQAVGLELDNLRKLSQLLIDDCRDFCLEHKFPLQLIQLDLFSNKYKNIKIIREDIKDGQLKYIVQMEYPEGVTPFEVPSSMQLTPSNVQSKKENELNAENDNDLFVLIPNLNYSSEGSAKFENITYADQGQKKKIENLLNTCDFFKVESPEKIIPQFSDNNQLTCSCDAKIGFKDLNIAKSSKFNEFEFYFIEGHPCYQCGKNPFVLFKKDKTIVPNELKDIFSS